MYELLSLAISSKNRLALRLRDIEQGHRQKMTDRHSDVFGKDNSQLDLIRVVLNTSNGRCDTIPIDAGLNFSDSTKCYINLPLCFVLAISHEAQNINTDCIEFFVSSLLFSSGHLGKTKRGLGFRYNCKIYISYTNGIMRVFLEQTEPDNEYFFGLIRGADTPYDPYGLMNGKIVGLVVSMISKNSTIREKTVIIPSKVIKKYGQATSSISIFGSKNEKT